LPGIWATLLIARLSVSGTVWQPPMRASGLFARAFDLRRRKQWRREWIWKGSRMAEGEYVRPLGEAGYGRNNGRVGILGRLSYSGLLVHEGLLLTRRAHEEFLHTSGVLLDIEAAAWRGEDARRQAAEIRSRHASYHVAGGLNRAICEALIEFNARAVIVLSEGLEKGGLRSIPEVKDAVREAWLSLRGLERQVEAAACGDDLPTWPLLIQRESHPRL
jgi:hypothetical protein